MKNVKPNSLVMFKWRVARIFWGCLIMACWRLAGPAFAADAPQAVLDPPVTHYFAGQAVSPVLLVKDLPQTTAPRQLLWRLMALDATLAEGAVDLPLAAGDAQSVITFNLPDLQRRTVMHLIARVSSESEGAPTLDKALVVYPRECPLSTASLKGKRIGVLDSNGGSDAHLVKIVESLGAKAESLASVDGVPSFDGDAVIIGTIAFDKAGMQERFLESLPGSEGAAPILVLPQLTNNAAGFGADGQRGEIVAPGHGIFYTLDEADMTGWQPNGLLGIPQGPRLELGSWRTLLADGTGPSPTQGALIMEQILPSARHLLWCQLPLDVAWDTEPVCRMLMINMLTCLLDSRSGTPLSQVSPSFYGDDQDAWLTGTAYALTGLDPRYDAPPIDNARPLAAARLVILDAGYESVKCVRDAQPDFFEALEPWVSQGGQAYVFSLGEEDAGLFAWALGERGRIEAIEGTDLKKADPVDPRLWGFGVADFALWARGKPGLSGFLPDPPGDSWAAILDPPAMARRPLGKGSIVFCGFQPPSERETAQGFWVPLLMDEGIMLKNNENK